MKLTITIVNRSPSHVHLSIWVNGALICDPGKICLRADELYPFLKRVNPDLVHEKTIDGFEEMDWR